MSRDAVTDLHNRSRTHGPPPPTVRRDTASTDDRAMGAIIDFGVVTGIVIDPQDPTKNHLKWRRVRFTAQLPIEGSAAMYGDELVGYPSPGRRVVDYEHWAYVAKDKAPGRYNVFPFLVVYANGSPILVWIDKPLPTVLDTTVPDSECPGS